MQTFKLEEVLSAAKGVLLCPIGKVFEVLNFLTGDSLYTHQLPRAIKECAPLVYNQHPFLEAINLSDINPDNWKEKLADLKAIHPNEIKLIPIMDYRHKDPLQEFREMCPDKEIITIDPNEIA